MSRLLSAVAIVGLLGGMAGGMFLGVKADAWLADHPGPCLVSQEECDAYHQDRPVSMAPIFFGLVGAMAGSAALTIPVMALQARNIKAVAEGEDHLPTGGN
jgi:hypothetical protein